MPKLKSPQDPNEHLKIKLLFMEATAVGRFPIACVTIVVGAASIGRAVGLW